MISNIILVILLASLSESMDIITRSEWGAREPKPDVGVVNGSVEFVIIHHSAMPFTTNKDESIQQVRAFQDLHLDKNGWSDIGYNFVVDEQGLIFEGRGYQKVGAHAPNYNAKSIGICVIGNFMERAPHSKALKAIKALIAHSIKHGHLNEDYTLKGHRDTRDTLCPGDFLYDIIKTWPHFG